jgi:hypothetical protein
MTALRRPPLVAPSVAAEMLALVDHALVAAPDGALPYLRGYLVARSWEPAERPPRPIDEPDFLGGAP